MRYEFKNRGEYKLLKLTLKLGELKYDIGNIAFAEGDVARVHDNYGHDILGDKGENYMHQFKDVCEEGNWDRVKRTIEVSKSELVQMLYAFTSTPLPDDVEETDVPKAEDDITISAYVPKYFAAQSAEYLLKLAHEYIVDAVLEDWAFITYPEGAATWNAKKSDTRDKIVHMRSYSGEKRSVKPSLI